MTTIRINHEVPEGFRTRLRTLNTVELWKVRQRYTAANKGQSRILDNRLDLIDQMLGGR